MSIGNGSFNILDMLGKCLTQLISAVFFTALSQQINDFSTGLNYPVNAFMSIDKTKFKLSTTTTKESMHTTVNEEET